MKKRILTVLAVAVLLMIPAVALYIYVDTLMERSIVCDYAMIDMTMLRAPDKLVYKPGRDGALELGGGEVEVLRLGSGGTEAFPMELFEEYISTDADFSVPGTYVVRMNTRMDAKEREAAYFEFTIQVAADGQS